MFYNNYAMYSYGIGSYNNYYYNYDSMLDDDKTMTVIGATIGWGKRLRWPDDYFQFQTVLGYTRYMLRDWSYFYIHNGNCNNINLGFTLSRTSTDNQLFPRHGSEFMASVTLTPPWSLFDNKDYRSWPRTPTLPPTRVNYRRSIVGLSTTSGSSSHVRSRLSQADKSVSC